jgi:hypothetical protein
MICVIVVPNVAWSTKPKKPLVSSSFVSGLVDVVDATNNCAPGAQNRSSGGPLVNGLLIIAEIASLPKND